MGVPYPSLLPIQGKAHQAKMPSKIWMKWSQLKLRVGERRWHQPKCMRGEGDARRLAFVPEEM